MRPPNVTFEPRKARNFKKKAVAVKQNANKRFATESVENVSAKKSLKLRNDSNPPHRLSMRLDDGKGRFRVSSRLNGGLPTKKNRALVSK